MQDMQNVTQMNSSAPVGKVNGGNDEIEIDLMELFLAFRKRLAAILLAGLIGGILGFGYSRLILTPIYTSTSMIYVIGTENIISSLADLQIGSQLTQDYKVMITNRSVMQRVIEEEGLDYDYKKLRKKISVNNPTGTRIMEIRVEDPDPVMAKEIVDSVARSASNYIADIMEQDPPKIIEEGEIPTQKTRPSNSRNALIAALLAMMAVMGVITFQVVTNDTIKTEDDIHNYFGVTVLAVVPLHEDEEESRRHHRRRRRKDDDDGNNDKEKLEVQIK